MAGIAYAFLVATAILAVGGVGTTMLAWLGGWPTLAGYRTSDAAFAGLFFFRYWRFVVHVAAYLLYRPRPLAATPRYRPADCTVIVPTVDPGTAVFRQCIASIAACRPAAILVVTVHGLEALAEAALAPVRLEFPGAGLQVHAYKEPNKRRQIDLVVGDLRTPVTVLADSTVGFICPLGANMDPIETLSPPCMLCHAGQEADAGTHRLTGSIEHFSGKSWLPLTTTVSLSWAPTSAWSARPTTQAHSGDCGPASITCK